MANQQQQTTSQQNTDVNTLRKQLEEAQGKITAIQNELSVEKQGNSKLSSQLKMAQDRVAYLEKERTHPDENEASARPERSKMLKPAATAEARFERYLTDTLNTIYQGHVTINQAIQSLYNYFRGLPRSEQAELVQNNRIINVAAQIEAYATVMRSELPAVIISYDPNKG